MISQIISAMARGLLMAVLIATPSLVLPSVSSDAAFFVVIVAMFSGALVFIEYYSTYPSILEFRFAPPFNRLRFVAVFLTVFMLASYFNAQANPSILYGLVKSLGLLIGNLLDFPYSPVRLVLASMPNDLDVDQLVSIRTAAGLSYFMSLVTLGLFYFMVRVLDWPTRIGAFNVWVNLPLFDPTAGGDVLKRLIRDSRLNVMLGALLPFLFPAFFKTLSDSVLPLQLEDPQTLIWTTVIWAFFPAGLVMRGIAMARIAAMIDENRKRAYAAAQGLQPV